MEQMTREKMGVQEERAILVAGLLPGYANDPHDPLGELRSLVETAGAVTVDLMLQNISKPSAATFIGKGKTEELGEMVKFHEADVVIFDNDLSPSQIGNIEEIIECKVLDRSEVILDIFAARAQTHQARLQVELAQLQYTYPRLRAMWSHLERIAGGSPQGMGTRGPGEQQLEVDRRIVQRRTSELKKEINRLHGRKQREVAARNRDFYSVGLVGYTNAGKSTLFNTAADGDAYADDKLFATLSTRTRKWNLGGGQNVMLSDTVGFVRDLPHHLVASFKATLEEAIHSNLLLIVLDIAHSRAAQQLETVMKVLDDIGATEQHRQLVFNKVDKLEHNADLLVFTEKYPDAITISAKTGQGVEDLMAVVRKFSTGEEREVLIRVDLKTGKAISFIESRTEILDREYGDGIVDYKLKLGVRQLDQLRAMGSGVKVVEE